jgi:lipid-binding SYLF domain-containing protein
VNTRSRIDRLIWVQLLVAIVACVNTGCSTAPKYHEQRTVLADSLTAVRWFNWSVPGLSRQLENSAGYISYPGIGQYGLVIGGGKFGRGVVFDNTRRQVGWAYLNTASAGLQLGAQGFKMLVVFEDDATMRRFKTNKLTGNVGATVVAGESGTAGTTSFTDGVAVYQGGQTGLMAGASIGLDYMRFEAVDR